VDALTFKFCINSDIEKKFVWLVDGWVLRANLVLALVQTKTLALKCSKAKQRKMFSTRQIEYESSREHRLHWEILNCVQFNPSHFFKSQTLFIMYFCAFSVGNF
jgi:hypothetical protein